jgi:hypothetical protein
VARDFHWGTPIRSVEVHLSGPLHGRSDIALRIRQRLPPIEAKLRRGLVKIRPAIQKASINTNCGDETRSPEDDNEANFWCLPCAWFVSGSQVAAADVNH